MKETSKLWLSLQHFADGGEGIGYAGELGTETGEDYRGDAGRETGANHSDSDLSDVIYGIGGDDEDGETVEHPDAGDGTTGRETEGTPEDLDAEFERMIAKDGKFRDVYNKRVQDIISRRFKTAKQERGTEEAAKSSVMSESVSSVFAELAAKYKLDAGDVEGIARAFLEDADRLEDEAMARGMSVDEMRRVKATERELAVHKSREKQRAEADAERARRAQAEQRSQEARRRYDGWVTEGEELKKIYPSFDLEAEAKNPAFVKALQGGMSVKMAYEGVHHDDLMKSAMTYTADKVEKGTADKIRANASRPVEGAAQGRAAVRHKTDVNDLTDADIEEILRRVKNGETIRF